MPESAARSAVSVVVRKYANRRLYDTAASRYVTLVELVRRVRAGESFRVVEARDGADITRQVLTQMLLDGENDPRRGVLDEEALARLLRVQGRHERGMFSAFLSDALDRFAGERWTPETRRTTPPTSGTGRGAQATPDHLRHVAARLEALQSRLRRLIDPDS